MPYLDILEKVWSAKAETYDTRDRTGPVPEWIHEMTRKVLKQYFSPGMAVLEIGCGTGEEAIFLAKSGVEVRAIDISYRMITLAREKAIREKVTEKVHFHICPAEELEKFETFSFKGAYSLLGPVNCFPDLKKFAGQLSELVLPGGYFICSVINRYCPWEWFYYLMKGNFNTAIRRLKTSPVKASICSEYPPLDLWYYTPQKYYSHFKENFSLIKCLALPVIIPPQYLNRAGRRYPEIFKILSRIEKYVYPYYPFNQLGDHFLMVMQRRSA